MAGRWQFWIDRGGTFTDVVARDPAGRLTTHKLLSDNPAQYDDAATHAMRMLSGTPPGETLPPADIRIGTTIATNALLERKGKDVLLVTTRGFADLLAIGTQERPDIFARAIAKPEPLPQRVVTVDERVDATGQVLRTLDEGNARGRLQAAYAEGLRSVAIVLLHGYRFPAHERALARMAREIGFAEVVTSADAGALEKIVARADTACADASLTPVLRRYVERFSRALDEGHEPLFMQSNGGLVPAARLRGKDAILSGPAGGIVGMARTGQEAGEAQLIGFDMGGTSTDVSLFAGEYERDEEARVAGVRIRAPMMRIHTVAAGGGSICAYDGARFTVGPDSAGAQPGPACYRMGGPLTVTDCNVILGKLRGQDFPPVFGPGADEPIDPEASHARMDEVLDAMRAAGAASLSAQEAAAGFVAIAVANMAKAIRAVSVARGHDCANFALNCFGGAGGQHACLVADALGMETVLVHPLSGVLSAYGMGLADRREVVERALSCRLHESEAALAQAARELREAVAERFAGQGGAGTAHEVRLTAFLRPAGGEAAIEVPLGSGEAMRDAFAAAHERRFGYDGLAQEPAGGLVVARLRAEGIAPAPPTGPLPFAPASHETPQAVDTATIWCAGEAREAPVYERAALPANHRIDGPALVLDPVATVMIEPGWSGAVDASGMLRLTRTEPRGTAQAAGALDPVRLEIFGGLFMSIAEEMGAALQHSARSVNIRERLDFSCALFDADGALIANAPHIPVHLGSMGDSVRTVLEARRGTMREGEAYALNAPYRGGTHLPDITVIRPVFLPGERAPAFFVAARGHHADIGGVAPGSMPADSTSIEEEGIVLDDVLLAERGELRAEAMRALLSSGPHPARNIDQNLADLSAQLAACHRGAQRLLELVAAYGADTVRAYMRHLLDYAAGQVEALLDTLPDGQCEAPMDNGATIRVTVTVDRDTRCAAIDFAGTSAQTPDNFNAPAPVVRAACLYAVRTLFDSAVPMNDGFLRPFDIRVPEGSMLSPRHPAAVVAGNVETSQVITDALLGAFGAMAASQGTMNNFTFGDAIRQYYETLAGGAGACAGHDGADAVQVHMTNSRLTDPEVLERRFPVLVEEHAVRRGSGGAGAARGGDGTVRRIRFREPMRANILSNRRTTGAFGLAGGSAGKSGANRIERADGSVETLGHTGGADMAPGDVFVIATPGGGGYGTA